MTTSWHPSLLAYFDEVVQGTPPVDAAAWLASGQWLRHIGESLDPSGIQQAVVEDMRSQVGIFHLNQKVKGLRNTEFPFNSYLTGSGAATADATQMAANPLASTLGHCLGGVNRGNTTVVTGGTELAPTVTSLTNIPAGSLVAFVDTSAGDNLLHWRRVVSLGALTLNLDEELDFTPANGDVCHAVATSYVDETPLSNSAVGPTTRSWLIQKGLAAARENFVLMGCKTMLESIALGRGDLPLLAFKTLAANFLGPQSAPNPAFTGTPAGAAPVAIGPRTEWQYQTVGTQTANRVHLYNFGLQVGVPATPIDTNGEVESNMQGRQGYSTGPADTIAQIGMDFTSTAWTQFEADTLKYLRFSKIATPGQGICIYIPRAEIATNPKRGRNGDVSSVEFDLRALPDPTGATALLQSKILIGIA